MALIRLQNWEDFKTSAANFKPKAIFVSVEEAPLKRPPIALRLTFYHEKDTYLFLDFAEGKIFRKTKIPVDYEERKASVKEDNIKDFIANQLGMDVEVISTGVIGWW